MPYADLKKRNMSAAKRRQLLGAAAPPKGLAPFQVTTNGKGRVVSVKSHVEGAPHDFEVQPKGHHLKGLSTLLDREGQVALQWAKTDMPAARREQLALESLAEHMRQYRGVGALLSSSHRVEPGDEDLQASILLGDPHIGMLSWHLETGNDFDLVIADQYMNAAVDLLVERTPRAGSCRVVNLGDFSHSNDQTNKTPRGGNQLDCDSRFAKVQRVGYNMLRRIVDRARQKYRRVEVISLQGNHDPTISLSLQLWLEAVYESDATVEIVPNENPYIVREFGNNLTLYHHGDGAKPEQCKDVLAAFDEGRPWGRCPYREIQGGHVHHLTRKEFPGCVFETSRTTAPADYWHHWKGYRAGRGMRSLVHHREFGRLSEHSVGSKEIELRIKGVA